MNSVSAAGLFGGSSSGLDPWGAPKKQAASIDPWGARPGTSAGISSRVPLGTALTKSLSDGALVAEDWTSTQESSGPVTAKPYDGPLKSLWRGAGAGTPIDMNDARLMRELTFGAKGNEMGEFGDNWRQPFHFHTAPGLEYGLWQEKGGPCGMIAAVQAHLLKHLLYGEQGRCDLKNKGQVNEKRRQALSLALSEILWRVGGERSAMVALHGAQEEGRGACRTSSYRPDGLTEQLCVWRFDAEEALQEFMFENLHMLEHGLHSGVVSFFYSVLLSKGLDGITEEMDNKECTLVGKFGYCTMEFMNLVLTGHAKSNVFDGDKDLSSGTDVMILGGVKEQSNIGQLTLFEVYGSVEVGSFLKSPKHPIWVVCSESHFSVLFSAEGEPMAHSNFDIYYYDELARQEAPIRLSVNPTAGKPMDIPKSGLSHAPPLELVLATKWPGCDVDWNGTEKIL